MKKAAIISCVALILAIVPSAVMMPALSANEVVTKPVYALTLSSSSATNQVGTNRVN